jgi:hypothetical protein
MRNRMLIAIAGAALCLAVPGRPAGAAPAASSSTQPPPAAHRGLFGFRHRNGAPTTGRPLFAGAIIGNKRTHVYHLPGDKGNLPAAQNRVYFHSAAEAAAAGYHAAGQRGAGATTGRHRNTMTGNSASASHGRRTLHPRSSPPTPTLPNQ